MMQWKKKKKGEMQKPNFASISNRNIIIYSECFLWRTQQRTRHTFLSCVYIFVITINKPQSCWQQRPVPCNRACFERAAVSGDCTVRLGQTGESKRTELLTGSWSRSLTPSQNWSCTLGAASCNVPYRGERPLDSHVFPRPALHTTHVLGLFVWGLEPRVALHTTHVLGLFI